MSRLAFYFRSFLSPRTFKDKLTYSVANTLKVSHYDPRACPERSLGKAIPRVDGDCFPANSGSQWHGASVTFGDFRKQNHLLACEEMVSFRIAMKVSRDP